MLFVAEATAKATEQAQLRSECELVTARYTASRLCYFWHSCKKAVRCIRCEKLETENKNIGEENRLLNLHAQKCCVRYNGGQEEQTQPSEDCMDKCSRLEVENLQLLEAINSLQSQVAADEAASSSWKAKCSEREGELSEREGELSEWELKVQAVNTALSESTQRCVQLDLLAWRNRRFRCSVVEAENKELQAQQGKLQEAQQNVHTYEQQLASYRELLRKRDESDVAALR